MLPLGTETQELYTTIDVLLARTVRDTTDRNKIFQELGYGISNALLDLFIWDESNRLRDALGHGGVAPQKISPHEVQCENKEDRKKEIRAVSHLDLSSSSSFSFGDSEFCMCSQI